MQLEQKILSIDGEQLACEYTLCDTNAVILHGAGAATNRTLCYGLAQDLLARGVGVVLFDFSGHGDSSGDLTRLSLERRQRQAQAVIDQLVPSGALYLIGFSMGAQTLCDILPHYLERTSGVLLCCPAIYDDAARQLPFGDPLFTKILRTPESWAASTAPARLARFHGRLVIAMGTEDTVIPAGVVRLLRQSAPQHSFREYQGVNHKLLSWFHDHPADAAGIIDELLDAA